MVRWVLAVLTGVVVAGLTGSAARLPAVAGPAPQLSLVEDTPGVFPAGWATGLATAAVTGAQAYERAAADAALTATLRQLDSVGAVDLAVAIVDRTTGRAWSYSGQRAFRTASIVKVDILATLLVQAQRAGRALTTSERDLAEIMIEQSDNDAASTLWRRTGGIAGTGSTFGLTATRPGGGGAWGETTTTAEDQVRLLGALADPAGPVRDAGYLLGLMGQVADDQNWGVTAAEGPGERTAVKNGWLSIADDRGRWVINSIGRITGSGTDLTIAVLSRGNASFESGVALVETVAKLVRPAIVSL